MRDLCFNPRTPCGVRLIIGSPIGLSGLFQSTHSLRSATRYGSRGSVHADVSIHALLAECDLVWRATPPHKSLFQSTHSLRSATSRIASVHPARKVSIHALLAECDRCFPLGGCLCACFNPRTPCGVRLRPTLYIATQQSKSYFAPTSLKRPSLHGCSF